MPEKAKAHCLVEPPPEKCMFVISHWGSSFHFYSWKTGKMTPPCHQPDRHWLYTHYIPMISPVSLDFASGFLENCWNRPPQHCAHAAREPYRLDSIAPPLGTGAIIRWADCFGENRHISNDLLANQPTINPNKKWNTSLPSANFLNCGKAVCLLGKTSNCNKWTMVSIANHSNLVNYQRVNHPNIENKPTPGRNDQMIPESPWEIARFFDTQIATWHLMTVTATPELASFTYYRMEYLSIYI